MFRFLPTLLHHNCSYQRLIENVSKSRFETIRIRFLCEQKGTSNLKTQQDKNDVRFLNEDTSDVVNWLESTVRLHTPQTTVSDYLKSFPNPLRELLVILKALPTVLEEKSKTQQGFAKLSIMEMENILNSDENLKRFLTKEIQLGAAEVLMEFRHRYIIDKIVDLYCLRSAELDFTYALNCLREKLKLSEFDQVSNIVKALGLQGHFSPEELYLPLLTLNKQQILFWLLEDQREVALEFVSYVDSIFLDENARESLVRSIPGSDLELVNPKSLLKVVNRLARTFDIEPEIFKNMSKFQSKSRYERETELAKWLKPIVDSVFSNKFIRAAISLAEEFGLSVGSAASRELRIRKLEYLISRIQIIDSAEKFKQFMEDIGENPLLLGVDMEFTRVIAYKRSGVDVIQIASEEKVWLIDVTALRSILEPRHWLEFIDRLFYSTTVTVIGFALRGDLCMLHRTFDFIPDDLLKWRNYVELQEIWIALLRHHPELIPFPPQDFQSVGYGLTNMVEGMTGKPLDKKVMLSRRVRPLRPEKMLFSARDVVCMVNIYNELQRVTQSSGTSVENLLKDIRSK